MTDDKLRAALDNLATHHELERVAGNTHSRPDRCEFVEQALAALAASATDEPQYGRVSGIATTPAGPNATVDFARPAVPALDVEHRKSLAWHHRQMMTSARNCSYCWNHRPAALSPKEPTE